ncbi:MAG: formyltransferase family protein [Planctomycetota bacterium]
MTARVPVIAVFVSGTGRTLRHLFEMTNSQQLLAKIGVVVASRECLAIEWAREQGLAVEKVRGDESGSELESTLEKHGAGWVVLAGYTRLVPVMPSYEYRVVNIHPALLPDFGGKGMYGTRVHRAVLESGATQSGCTVHLCDDRYDTGPIVAQSVCDVQTGDTPETLAARVFERELDLYPRALASLFAGFKVVKGRVELSQPVLGARSR